MSVTWDLPLRGTGTSKWGPPSREQRDHLSHLINAEVDPTKTLCGIPGDGNGTAEASYVPDCVVCWDIARGMGYPN